MHAPCKRENWVQLPEQAFIRYQYVTSTVATSDTTAELLFAFRVEKIEGLGFTPEQAATLAEAKKIITEITVWGSVREHEVQLQWHDVFNLQQKGATHDQVLAILT